MKKTTLFAAFAFAAFTTFAQEPVQQEVKKWSNPTADSIHAKYSLAPMPNQMSTSDVFPVIGEYQSNATTTQTDATSATSADVQKITITLDEQNKGVIWISGLPQGKIMARLKKSPATYKIPAQKSDMDKDVMEGTLVYDKDSKVINIVLGKAYNDEDPASAFTTSTEATDVAVTKTKTKKTKTKVKKVQPWVFTGTKIESVTAMQ